MKKLMVAVALAFVSMAGMANLVTTSGSMP